MMPTWCASFREELLAETTMPLKWIAERLQMGTRGHLTHLLYHHQRDANSDTTQPQLWQQT